MKTVTVYGMDNSVSLTFFGKSYFSEMIARVDKDLPFDSEMLELIQI